MHLHDQACIRMPPGTDTALPLHQHLTACGIWALATHKIHACDCSCAAEGMFMTLQIAEVGTAVLKCVNFG